MRDNVAGEQLTPVEYIFIIGIGIILILFVILIVSGIQSVNEHIRDIGNGVGTNDVEVVE